MIHLLDKQGQGNEQRIISLYSTVELLKPMNIHMFNNVLLYLTFNFITLVLYLTIKKQIEKIEGTNVSPEHAVLIKYFKYTHNITYFNICKCH